MNIMWAIIALSGLGLVTAIIAFFQSKKGSYDDEVTSTQEEEQVKVSSGACCGMHSTCEKDSLLAAISSEIVYYDDEELDRYKGTDSNAYSEDSINEFREILFTLQDDDVAGWVRSLQLREIEIPDTLKPEIYLIVGEKRIAHSKEAV